MLFQAAHNLTWLFATLPHCLEHTRCCVGEDHKIDFLGFSEYTVHLNGKWHTVTWSWKVPKIKNLICQPLWRVTEATSGWRQRNSEFGNAGFHSEMLPQIHVSTTKLKKKELKENESSEFHFVSHLFPKNLSHLVPICKYIQHSCNSYNVRISSTPCI